MKLAVRMFSFALLALALAACATSDAAVNTLLAETAHPAGTMKAVIFERSGGTKGGVTTQVSIMPLDERLSERAGNVFISDDTKSVAAAGRRAGIKVKCGSDQQSSRSPTLPVSGSIGPKRPSPTWRFPTRFWVLVQAEGRAAR